MKTADAEMPLPSNPQTFFVGGLFALAVLTVLYVASPIIQAGGVILGNY